MSIKYTNNINTVLSDIDQAKDRALEIIGGMAESYAVQNITKNHSVVTGNLRGSITHKQIDKYTEVVGTNVEYAPYVELGHHQEPGRYVPAIKKRLKASFVPGKPFLRPAVENHKDQYVRVLETEFAKIEK